jgi:formylmethanofuran dehydrogenase subunit D
MPFRRENMEQTLRLTSKESELKDQSGYARIHTEVYNQLEIEEKDRIEVVNDEGKAILVKVNHDTIIPRNEVRLGPKDLEKLEISEGDEVGLKAHKTVGDTLREKKDKIVDKIKKRDEKKQGDE